MRQQRRILRTMLIKRRNRYDNSALPNEYAHRLLPLSAMLLPSASRLLMSKRYWLLMRGVFQDIVNKKRKGFSPKIRRVEFLSAQFIFIWYS